MTRKRSLINGIRSKTGKRENMSNGTYVCAKCGEGDLGMYGHHDSATGGFTCEKKGTNMNIDITKKYTTRDGREVRIYAVDGGGIHPVHGAIKMDDGSWKGCQWYSNGDNFSGNCYDLIPVKTWRAWKCHEMPKFFIIRHKEVGSLYAETADKIIGDDYLKLLLENYMRVHEDGTETPCGVCE
jgi:hypothetical protein